MVSDSFDLHEGSVQLAYNNTSTVNTLQKATSGKLTAHNQCEGELDLIETAHHTKRILMVSC